MGKTGGCLKSVEHQEHVAGLIPYNLGACRRRCNVKKAGVATCLLLAVKAPLEVTCKSREWFNYLQPPLLFEDTYRIFLPGRKPMRTLHLIKALLSIVSSGDKSKHPILLLGEADCCMTESDMAAEGEEWKVIVEGAEERLIQTVTRTHLSPTQSWSLVGPY